MKIKKWIALSLICAIMLCFGGCSLNEQQQEFVDRIEQKIGENSLTTQEYLALFEQYDKLSETDKRNRTVKNAYAELANAAYTVYTNNMMEIKTSMDEYDLEKAYTVLSETKSLGLNLSAASSLLKSDKADPRYSYKTIGASVEALGQWETQIVDMCYKNTFIVKYEYITGFDGLIEQANEGAHVAYMYNYSSSQEASPDLDKYMDFMEKHYKITNEGRFGELYSAEISMGNGKKCICICYVYEQKIYRIYYRIYLLIHS